uniref:Uncharacterized protein n=1 Tax=Macaca fascicularis TaxID=9541 RepID=A0A7N9CD35_MACFA
MSGLPGSTPRKRQPCSRHCTATVTSSKVCLYDAAEGTPASQAEPIGTRGGAAGSSRPRQAAWPRWPQVARLGRMAAATERALPRLQALARQPPPISNEEELYDCLDYYYLRDFPASGARSKAPSARRRTNRLHLAGTAQGPAEAPQWPASAASASCRPGCSPHLSLGYRRTCSKYFL